MSAFHTMSVEVCRIGIFFLGFLGLLAAIALVCAGVAWVVFSFVGVDGGKPGDCREEASWSVRVAIVSANALWICVVGMLAFAYGVDALGGSLQWEKCDAERREGAGDE